MLILTTILGIIAITIWVLSIVQKEKTHILLYQIASNFIYGLQYVILNAFSAGILNFSSFVRLSVYYYFEKKGKSIPKIIFIFFLFIIVGIGIFTYNNWLDLIPVVITIFYAYSFWQENLVLSRIVYILCAFVWIYFNFSVKAYITILGNVLEILVGGYSLYLYSMKENQKSK